MNYGKYDAICCKHYFYLMICNDLSKNNKYNDNSYNPTAIKLQCIFAWLFFTMYC